MPQSNVIVGALVIAFLMFITVRGELPDYIELFTTKRAPSTEGSQKASSSGIDGQDLLDLGSEYLGSSEGDYATNGGNDYSASDGTASI